jgi:subtilisin family serine protease
MIKIYSGRKSEPLRDALVSFETRGSSDDDNLPQGRSDQAGLVHIEVPAPSPKIMLIADAPEHETMIFDHDRPGYEIILRKLPKPNRYMGWWHKLCGITQFDQSSGSSLRIGVIDSGFGPLPSLDHCHDLGAISSAGGHDASPSRTDFECHGTAVVSLIGARPAQADEYAGMAPAAEIYSVRVVHEGNGGLREHNQRIVQDAFDLLLEKPVDLINCSFGFPDQDPAIEHFIEAARARGILCICAAGNSGKTLYPASSPLTVSVAALGDRTKLRRHTPAYQTIPDPALRGRWSDELFAPLFTAPGNCIAPGVGIIASDPPHHNWPATNKAKTGTSFACPVVTGLLAAVLAADPVYRQFPRDHTRCDYARQRLQSLCRPLKFSSGLQGFGLPDLKRINPKSNPK